MLETTSNTGNEYTTYLFRDSQHPVPDTAKLVVTVVGLQDTAGGNEHGEQWNLCNDYNSRWVHARSMT